MPTEMFSLGCSIKIFVATLRLLWRYHNPHAINHTTPALMRARIYAAKNKQIRKQTPKTKPFPQAQGRSIAGWRQSHRPSHNHWRVGTGLELPASLKTCLLAVLTGTHLQQVSSRVHNISSGGWMFLWYTLSCQGKRASRRTYNTSPGMLMLEGNILQVLLDGPTRAWEPISCYKPTPVLCSCLGQANCTVQHGLVVPKQALPELALHFVFYVISQAINWEVAAVGSDQHFSNTK